MDRKPSVFACVTTRGAEVDADVRGRVEKAVAVANAVGACAASWGQSADSYGIATGRNKAVAELMRQGYDWLWFVDDDVHVQPDALVTLLALAREKGCEVAAGCYPTVKIKADTGQAAPYLTVRVGGQWVRGWFDGPRECDAAGTGCLLISRRAFDAVGFPWFVWRETWDAAAGKLDRKSDDVDFCDRAVAAGCRIWAHGNVRCGHVKKVDVANWVGPEGRPVPLVAWNGPTTVAQQFAWPAYGSHANALATVATLTPVRTVVEYGAGRYSTPLFLDRAVFPDVERVVSVESDPAWAADVLRRAGGDPRLDLRVVPLADMPAAAVPDADLVFVDCDAPHATATGRRDYSVRRLLLERHARPGGAGRVVAAHDSDFNDVRPAVAAAAARVRHSAEYTPPFGPRTALLSDEVDFSGAAWADVPVPRG